MAEPNVEAAWRAEFKRIHATEAFHSANVFPEDPKAAFRWSVMKLKLDGSKKSMPTTIFGGLS
jgi:hypothetical protein